MMRTIKNKLPLLMLMMLTCAPVSGAFAQQPTDSTRSAKQQQSVPSARRPQISDDLLKQYEQALLEVEHLRTQVAGKDEIIRQKDAQIGALNSLADIQKARAESLLEAVRERTTANTIDDKRVVLYEASITDLKAETKRLMAERDNARSAQKWWGAAGLVLGFFTGQRGK